MLRCTSLVLCEISFITDDDLRLESGFLTARESESEFCPFLPPAAESSAVTEDDLCLESGFRLVVKHDCESFW